MAGYLKNINPTSEHVLDYASKHFVAVLYGVVAPRLSKGYLEQVKSVTTLFLSYRTIAMRLK
jgi:uncharacterized membrane protein